MCCHCASFILTESHCLYFWRVIHLGRTGANLFTDNASHVFCVSIILYFKILNCQRNVSTLLNMIDIVSLYLQVPVLVETFKSQSE